MAEFEALLVDELEDEELLLFFDGDTDQEPYPNNWPRFELERYSDSECLTMFRFHKDDIYKLARLFQLPEETKAESRIVWNAIEGLCIMLRRLVYPNRLRDLMPIFGRPESCLSIIFNSVVKHVYEHFSHLITNLNHPWLSHDKLLDYASVVHNSGAPVTRCWGFIDGTVMPIKNQREVYNGHKRTHALKYQSLVIPNSIVANLFGPIEGRRHDAALLAESDLMNNIRYFADENMPLCIYGDSAYPLNEHLLCPYKGGLITEDQEKFNKSMSSARQCVEWTFGKISTLFAFVDYKKNQKLYLQPVGMYYSVCAILTNCHTCLYGSQTASYFNVEPPQLEEYLTE